MRAAIDRLPSGRFLARLMIGGQRYTAMLSMQRKTSDWRIVTQAGCSSTFGGLLGVRRGAAVRDCGARGFADLVGATRRAPFADAVVDGMRARSPLED